MNSGWASEIGAVFRKEWLSEQRSHSGFLTALLSSILTVAAIAFGTFTTQLQGTLAAGLFWVALSFSATAALPRNFLSEEEAATADLLRLYARPHAVFWGKAIFNFVQMLLTSTILTVLFVALMKLKIESPALMVFSVVGGAAALAGTVTFCAALVAQGSNRSTLVGVISLPVLVPLILIGIAAVQAAFGDGPVNKGVTACAGLWLYAAAGFSIAPTLFAAVWRQS